MAEKRKMSNISDSDAGTCAGASQSLYADPAVYDILYTPGTSIEMAVLERLERRLAAGPLPEDRLWFEPACGTGRCLRLAARHGRRVAGFDREPAMLDYARGRVPLATLFVADLVDFAAAAAAAGVAPGSVDFAFNTVNSFRHLASDDEVRAHFRQMFEILRPGAVYLVGLSLSDYTWLWPDEDVWSGVRGRCRVSQVVNYLPPEPGTARGRLERALSHLTVTRPGGEEHLDDAYDLRCYDAEEWRQLVAASPFEHAGSFNALGKVLPPGVWAYQLEALRRPVEAPDV